MFLFEFISAEGTPCERSEVGLRGLYLNLFELRVLI